MGWQLAGHAGERTPDGMQRLLATADWVTVAPTHQARDRRAHYHRREGRYGLTITTPR
ncbi:MAG TPA: hypothetical protein VGC06_22180 [Actinomycetes bacterium]